MRRGVVAVIRMIRKFAKSGGGNRQHPRRRSECPSNCPEGCNKAYVERSCIYLGPEPPEGVEGNQTPFIPPEVGGGKEPYEVYSLNMGILGLAAVGLRRRSSEFL